MHGKIRCKGYVLPPLLVFLFEGKFWSGHVCIRTGILVLRQLSILIA